MTQKEFKKIENIIFNYAIKNCSVRTWSVYEPLKLNFGSCQGYENAKKLLKYVYKNYRNFYFHIESAIQFIGGRLQKKHNFDSKISYEINQKTNEIYNYCLTWYYHKNGGLK